MATCIGGVVEKKSCSASSACVGAACVELKMASGETPERGHLRTPTGYGWVNAWSVATPIARKLADAYATSGDVETLGGVKTFHRSCAPSGLVVPRAQGLGKNDGQVLSIATTHVFTDTAKKLVLALSVSGKLEVYLNGKSVAALDEPRNTGRKIFPDEKSFPVELAKGANQVTLILEAPHSPERLGSFYLRFRTPEGDTAKGLAFAETYQSASCDEGELLDPGASIDVGKDGLSVTLHPTFNGLLPRSKGPITVNASTLLRNGTKATKTETVPFSFRDEGRANGAINVPISLEGEGEVTVSLGSSVAFTQHLPSYLEKTAGGSGAPLLERITKINARYQQTRGQTLPEGSRASLDQQLKSLNALIGHGDDDKPYLERQTKLTEELLGDVEAGKDPYADRTGVVQRAYRSPLDGSLQPYIAYVPPSQKKGKPEALVLISHGRNRSPEHALRTLVGEAPDEKMTLRFAARNMPHFPDQNAILVAPLEFDEGSSYPLGEDDVLRVIDQVSTSYLVDPSKVSLTGYSLGGTVAFVLPLHYPDVFSASAPLCGYPNLMGYGNVAGVSRAPWEDALLAKKYIANYAENGQFLPLHIVHGGKDVPERSKVMVERYKDLGYTYIFDVQDDLDHNVWDHGYEDGRMIAWLSHRNRPKSPKHVRFVTGEYRYDRSYWVRLYGIKDSSALEKASIDARVDEKERKITIKTANVSAFSLDLAKVEMKGSGNVILDIDGEVQAAPPNQTAFFTAASKWDLGSEEPSRKGMKRHGVSGPISDALRHPLVFVYGTRDPAHAAIDRMVAEELAESGGGSDVEYPVTARFPVFADKDVSDEMLAKKSLVLIGPPSDNSLTEKYAASLPIKFEADAIVVRGKRYPGKGVGTSFIAPRPDDPDEYVVVHAGLDVDGTLAARFLPRFVPDFLVYDGRITGERGGLIMDQRPTLAGGYFGEDWQ